MRRHLILAALAAAAAVALAPPVSAQRRGAKAPTATGGDGTLYIGTYKGEIEIYDEAAEKLEGTIKLKTGIPRSLTPSPDRTRFYALNSWFEEIEVIDIATRTTLDSFKLSQGNKRVRVNSLVPSPDNKSLILLYKTATKLIDRWEIGPPTVQQFDLATKQFTHVVPWPKGEPRERLDMRFGPDGKHLYLFGDDVTVLETTNFTQVGSWPYAQPEEDGLGRISLGPSFDFFDPPGTFTGLFTMQDAIEHRRLMGIGRVDLDARKVTFDPLGPASPVGSFAKSPDGKRAYGLIQDIGNYQMWTFDLEHNQVIKRTEFEGRPRMGLRVSSNGKFIYVYVAGATVDLWDAATHTYVRTLHLGGDQTTELFVVPSKTGAPKPTAEGR
ncbi:MAG: WD40 repeat domain-containing protein [Vicinamibacterales bacterium]